MTEITLTAAQQLANLMIDQGAYRAETKEIEIEGIKATLVILHHEDQRDGEWRSIHVLGGDGVATIGTKP